MIEQALIDTSALLALANRRDQYHERAKSAVKTLVEAGCRLAGTTLILAEFHAHLLHRTDPRRARSVLAVLLRDPLYEWHDVPLELVNDATGRWLERFQDQRLSLTDAVSFELMRRERIDSAFAYDEDFTTAGFETVG